METAKKCVRVAVRHKNALFCDGVNPKELGQRSQRASGARHDAVTAARQCRSVAKPLNPNLSLGKTTFRSDRYQFTVVMPNLNYGVPQDVPQRVPQDVPQDDLDAKIPALIQKDNKISTEKLGMALGVSYKTIRRHIKAMGNVRYIGRGFSGHWEVENQSKTGI